MAETNIGLNNHNEINIKKKLSDGQPLVSIIVATYRRDTALEKALLSIANQTYEFIEIVVVDDNDNEMWNEKVDAIICSFKLIFNLQIIYIKNETNKGSAETRNIGIRSASGKYITFLDDDDIYLPNKVKRQIEHMIERESDFSLTDLNLYDENDSLIEKRNRKYIRQADKDSLLKYHLMYHMTGTDTMMFKKTYLLSIGGFPPINVGDEFYLMQNAIDANGKFSYLPVCDIKAYVHTETDGLSSGEGKINGENKLYEYKKIYFYKLRYREKRYIKMRHFAVIAFAELRNKSVAGFIKNSILSLIHSPFQCFKLFINRIQ